MRCGAMMNGWYGVVLSGLAMQCGEGEEWRCGVVKRGLVLRVVLSGLVMQLGKGEELYCAEVSRGTVMPCGDVMSNDAV